MSFWKIFFGSLLGFLAGSMLMVFLSFLILAGIMASFSRQEPVAVKENSVITLDLDYELLEQTTYSPFADFSFSRFEPTVNLGLYDLLKNIERAKKDENIRGIYLNSGWVGAGTATVEAIRDALIDFKASGKFIVSYAEIYSERAYYLGSVADQVFVNPKGLLEFNGINAQYTFYKGLLEKIGVEAQVFYDGKYKTATEPFRLDSMSAANEVMTRSLIDDLQGHLIRGISEQRSISVATTDSVSRHLLVRTAHDAVVQKLADSAYFSDQVQGFIKRKLGIEETEKINYISMLRYSKSGGHAKTDADKSGENPSANDRIAVLIAQGDIVDGRGDERSIGSNRYADLLKKLRDDDKVKAIVFRINSPGGSALASDVIAREVAITVKKKPVIVSMGDYAASGGYYIAAPATLIVAEPNTLTGSIGVFGILPNMQKLFEEKLGVTFDNVQTGIYSDMGSVSRPLREDEKRIIQNQVDSIYADFKKVVVLGRNLSEAEVDSIAQGRVWTGNQALANKLVDSLGGMKEAIRLAAQKAGIDSYRLVEYPQPESEWKVLAELFGEERKTRMIQDELGIYYPLYEELAALSKLKGVQARLPFLLTLD